MLPAPQISDAELEEVYTLDFHYILLRPKDLDVCTPVHCICSTCMDDGFFLRW